MCHFTTTYHTPCKHYSRPAYTLCPPAASDPVTFSRGCHNTRDLGLDTDFSSECVACQRSRARQLFFGGISAEPAPISYGIVAARAGGRAPSVVVTSAVDTAGSSSLAGGSRRSSISSGLTRSDSTMSLDSMSSQTTLSSAYTSSSSTAAGSYGGWSFKGGKFGNAHWRMYQSDDDAAPKVSSSSSSSMYAVQPSKQQQQRSGTLKSIREI